MQEISFSLCHVFARSTRSVSIPAPVDCKRGSLHFDKINHSRLFVFFFFQDAHLVCSRAKHHYAPGGDLDFSDTATQASSSAEIQLEAHKTAYKPLHKNQASVMSFMVI